MPHSLARPMMPARKWGRRGGRKAPAAMVVMLLLAGCSGVKVDHIAQAPVHVAAPPTSLLVDVVLSPDVRADSGATNAAMVLQADLVKRYRKAGLLAYPAAGAPPEPGVAILHLRIDRADPGNRLKRVVVGFGAGRSTLSTDASLEMVGGASPALSFSSSANSGRKPGLILPGGIAAATGNLTHLAIGGGLDLLLVGRSGLEREADQTASAIVRQTGKFYRTAGWTWPGSAPGGA